MTASEDPDNARLTPEDPQKTGRRSVVNHGSK